MYLYNSQSFPPHSVSTESDSLVQLIHLHPICPIFLAKIIIIIIFNTYEHANFIKISVIGPWLHSDPYTILIPKIYDL